MAALIVVGAPSQNGGRRVSVMRRGREDFLGTAFSEQDVIVFLEASGLSDPEEVLDDPRWVRWSGGRVWHPSPYSG
ncbi:hypothetical protein PV371_36700 [Streptomyces sp. TX20-6-3]|uniref:hypothetical protein n=1 Tax=Streptomyces sp. TX20-6-3 TaxID=3028705 RepID=UPI0029A6DE18|nr:hypothetical protein [Streptomyces sp. TX20-6-3]MDX2565165.1 hypothetical protein [Streptomyces sp. TX20-6-3]